MKCDCINIIEKELSEHFPNSKLDVSLGFPSMDEMLTIPFEYKPTGAKRIKKSCLVVSFCPFCGKEAK